MKTLDAGREREALAEILVIWRAAEFIAPSRANSFHVRVRRLARLVGRSRADVAADISTDADLLDLDVQL